MINLNDPIVGQKIMLTLSVIFSIITLCGAIKFIKPFTREKW